MVLLATPFSQRTQRFSSGVDASATAPSYTSVKPLCLGMMQEHSEQFVEVKDGGSGGGSGKELSLLIFHALEVTDAADGGRRRREPTYRVKKSKRYLSFMHGKS